MGSTELSNYKKREEPLLPDWVTKGSKTTEYLYKLVQEEINNIKCQILSGERLTTKEFSIVLAKIARKANVNRSLLNKRRQPELVEYISKENVKLKALWSAQNELMSGKHPSKKELINEVSRLRDKCTQLEKSHYRQYLEEAIEMELLSSQRELAEKYKHLMTQYEILLEKNANLQTTNLRLLEALNKK